MSLSRRHVRAIVRKELREYRHNGQIVWTMAVIPLVFVLPTIINIFGAAAGSSPADLLLYMLGIPALVPAVVAAYSVVGERQQGTLEPVLTTPMRREEFMLGKALAALVPSLAISYGVYVVVVACVELFARPGVAAELVRWPELLAQLVFTPLLAGWSIWVGIAISTRFGEVRVAQQLGALASFPSVLVTALIAYGVIPASLGLAIGGAVLLLVLNGIGWRVTSAAFQRERLISGTR
jgi:ABC-type transport system involved in multi-copper enzyme maturation permease subunit